MVIIGNKSNFVDGSYGALVWFGQIYDNYSGGNGNCFLFQQTDTMLGWWNGTGAPYQLNTTGATYYWVAFG